MTASVREGLGRDTESTRQVEVAARKSDQEAKEQGLRGAYESLAAGLVERAAERCEGNGEWTLRIRGGLESLLGELAARPEIARAIMRSLPAVGPAGYRSYVGFLEAFVPFLAEGREYAEALAELPEEIEMLAIGAAETIVVGEIDAGRTTQLPSLLPSILFSVLVPFLGPEAASEAMQEAGRRGAGE